MYNRTKIIQILPFGMLLAVVSLYQIQSVLKIENFIVSPMVKCMDKRKDIAFLKVHKCGSTSVSNILQRFGLRNNLNFVLPDKQNKENIQYWVLGNVSDLSQAKIIGLPPGEVYNILSVDTIFNAQSYRKLIPNKPFLLAIIREPVERYISSDFYFGYSGDLVKRYGSNPFVYAHISNSTKMENSALYCMAYDFGLKPSALLNDTAILDYKNHVDKEFDFVMVKEYFDESLVLLKRKLCWETQDIVYIIRNVHKYKYALKPSHRQAIHNILKADVVLYNHFKHKLQTEIIKGGEDFLEEVQQFKIILKLVRDFCIYKEGGDILTIPTNKWSDEFTLYRTECEKILWTEFPLVELLQKRQRDKLK